MIDLIELISLDGLGRGAGTRLFRRPWSSRMIFIPAMKSLRSGTCAGQLLPVMRSAVMPSVRSSLRQAHTE